MDGRNYKNNSPALAEVVGGLEMKNNECMSGTLWLVGGANIIIYLAIWQTHVVGVGDLIIY